MQIINEYPPNIVEIDRHFHVLENKKFGVLYCWDTVIYNPDKVTIPPWLYRHEEVHSNRQEGSPVDWWDQYLKDTDFRLKEELQAHQVEWNVYQQHNKDRNQRIKYLHYISQRLSGPFYENLIGFSEAKELIQKS